VGVTKWDSEGRGQRARYKGTQARLQQLAVDKRAAIRWCFVRCSRSRYLSLISRTHHHPTPMRLNHPELVKSESLGATAAARRLPASSTTNALDSLASPTRCLNSGSGSFRALLRTCTARCDSVLQIREQTAVQQDTIKY